MDGKTGANRIQRGRARDGTRNLKECGLPVGAADEKQRFSRAERLAMDGKTGAGRSQRGRARDGLK